MCCSRGHHRRQPPTALSRADPASRIEQPSGSSTVLVGRELLEADDCLATRKVHWAACRQPRIRVRFRRRPSPPAGLEMPPTVHVN